jgi:hypothetical protein
MFLILCDAEKKNCLKILRKVRGGLEARVEGFGHREAGSAELGLLGLSVDVGSGTGTEFGKLNVQVKLRNCK